MSDDGEMASFLLSAMPFTGHVAPMTAVAEHLVARGHAVRFYTGEAFRARVEASGAVLVPWRRAPNFDENNLSATFPRAVGRKGLGQLLINVEDVMIGTAPAQNIDLDAEFAREPWDAMGTEEVSVGAALFAERTGCAWGTVAILPLNMTVTSGPPSGLGLTPGRNIVTKTRDAALRAVVPLLARRLDKPLRRARAAAGVAPAKLSFEDIVFSRRLVIASGAPALDFGRSDRPDHVHFVGELRATATSAEQERPPWWADLDGHRVVHVTQGTQNIDPTELIRPTLTALADRDVMVVVTTGIRGRDELPFAVPPNARVTGFVPYADLLPRVDVMITNGGWGGTLAALARDIPLIIGGGDLDKPEIAARVAWTGAGVNLKTATPTVAAVADAYARVTSGSSVRTAAARVGEELRSLGGALGAAELLEQLLPAR